MRQEIIRIIRIRSSKRNIKHRSLSSTTCSAIHFTLDDESRHRGDLDPGGSHTLGIEITLIFGIDVIASDSIFRRSR